MKNFKVLYLIDISSFIFRAFYAIRPLTTADGIPVNAVYGVATMLMRLFDEADSEYIGVVFDSKEPSSRKIEYPEYKANRSAPPDELIPQFDWIEKWIQTVQLPGFRMSGVEADDIIATLAKKWVAAADDNRVVIVTGDKDLMALVDHKTQIWDTMNDKHYTAHEVQEKFGVLPRQIRDYLALVGDTSDNIPGVAGIGAKGAAQLLGEFDTLEGILKAADDGKIPGKKGESIRDNKSDALLSQKLATLMTDIQVPFDATKLKYKFKVTQEMVDLCKRLEFKGLVKKWEPLLTAGSESSSAGSGGAAGDQMALSFSAPEAPAKSGGEFISIQSEKDFKALLKELEKAPVIAIDTETTSLDASTANLVGISLAVDDKRGFYIPIAHKQLCAPQLKLDHVIEGLSGIFHSKKHLKVGQNLKYDLKIFRRHGISDIAPIGDTMVAAYDVDPTTRHNLDFLAKSYLSYDMLSYEEVCGKGAKAIGFDEVPIEKATRYSAEDAWATFCLYQRLTPELERLHVRKLYDEVDLPLVQVLADMELTGILVDQPYLTNLEKEFEGDLLKLEGKVRALSENKELNLNSPKQLGKFLFEELKLPTQGKTKTGFSTDASTLEALADVHEAPRLILEYREIAKLQGTYVQPLREAASKNDQRVRTSFHLAGTATGRLSSSDPNLQNIPARTERGQRIRRAFIPEKGSVLLSADYSQIELRILAHLSGDKNLCASFQKGEDVHRRTAAEMYHIQPEAVTDTQRSAAKAINFGLMYGKTIFGLAEELNISRTEAKQMIERYFARYSGVKEFLDGVIETAKDQGYVETLYGRKRQIHELKNSNPMIRQMGERIAMNTPIQGTAADLIKVAMVQLQKRLVQEKLKSKILLQVHDELVLECPKSESKQVEALTKEVMENAIQLQVPLIANTSIGDSWADL